MAAITIQLTRLLWQQQRLRTVLATAQPAELAIRRLVSECCQRIQIARVPETRVTQLEVSPFVCRLNRPILVLPRSITESASALQLRQIVLHELAHLQRGDLVWCWITYAARLVYWFNPVAHWVASREALERELACDELAMSHSGSTAADYARTLVEAVSRVSRPTVLRAAMAAHLEGSEA
jgi:beta-lactamase regulating signal transducer with metallopeptidase domain